MYRWFLASTLVLLTALAVPRGGTAQDLGMVTGSTKGTYIKIGRDISQLVKPHGITLEVHESKGSIENVLAIRWKAGIQMGIVQSDVLEYVRQLAADTDRANRDQLMDLLDSIKMVFPLYNEEIHILARPEIQRLADLNGKRVAIDAKNSGTYLTSIVLFKLAGIEPAEIYPRGGEDAIEALRRGELDAMSFVAGQPAELFQQMVREEDGFVFVPVVDQTIIGSGLYAGARIEPESYPWLLKPVDTAAVKAVLVAYNYRGENCGHIGRLAKLIYEGFDELKHNGHSKWKRVSLDQQLRQWDLYDCVEDALPEVAVSSEPEAAGSTLSEPSDEPDLLRDLLRE